MKTVRPCWRWGPAPRLYNKMPCFFLKNGGNSAGEYGFVKSTLVCLCEAFFARRTSFARHPLHGLGGDCFAAANLVGVASQRQTRTIAGRGNSLPKTIPIGYN